MAYSLVQKHWHISASTTVVVFYLN